MNGGMFFYLSYNTTTRGSSAKNQQKSPYTLETSCGCCGAAVPSDEAAFRIGLLGNLEYLLEFGVAYYGIILLGHYNAFHCIAHA